LLSNQRILTRFILALTLTAGLQWAGAQTADQSGTNAAVSPADAAWKEVVKVSRPPMPPPEWQAKRPTPEEVEVFKKEQGELAGQAADKAKAFYTTYPTHPKATEAHKKEYEMLGFAVRLGNTNRTAALETAEQERLSDPTLSEDDRYGMRFQAVQRAMMVKPPENEKEAAAAEEKAGRTLIKEFPKRPGGYQMLMAAASQSDEATARRLAKEILAMNPPEGAKAAAEGLLRKFDSVGKPLPIKYTAVDGRDVDVTKLNGKVVLVDFWATWCGPCVAELPHVKAAYDKLHAKGFEIVGISFDSDKAKLETFVAENEMKWPQFFDGKAWQNKFGQEYGINSIPAMWLVDKKGNLRDMNGRDGLEEKHAEMQKRLEQVRDVGEKWFSLTEEEKERERAIWDA